MEANPGREPVIRTVPMPADANANGDIFGGWVLNQMDIAGGVAAGPVVKGRMATVAVEAMKFHRPIAIGDLVSIYADIVRIGTTSISVHMQPLVIRRNEAEPILVTEGTYVYVAIDDGGRPRPILRPG